MRCVLDASAGAELVAASSARGIVESLSHYVEVFAPVHFDVECASAVRRYWLRGLLERAEMESAVRAIPRLPVTRVPIPALLDRAVDMASNVTIQDALYLALAELLSADLLTLDKRLVGVPETGCRVVLLD